MTKHSLFSSLVLVSLLTAAGCTEQSIITSMAICGDGIITADEKCDDRNKKSDDGCRADCLAVEDGYTCPKAGEKCVKKGSNAVCGNEKVEGDEECDDGNKVSKDGCSSTCTIEDGYMCPEEGGKCTPITVVAKCGNRNVEGDEECDDGGRQNGDGCDADCHVEDGYDCPKEGGPCIKQLRCGDGILTGERGEECDDGNAKSNDGCSNECKIEKDYECAIPGKPCRRKTCGNGQPDYGEECDFGEDTVEYADSAADADFLCTAWCQRPFYCGDGISGDAVAIEHGEECDAGPFGAENDYPGCSKTCKRINYCGDRKVSHQEECDDGNDESGDGCSATCKVETGFACKPDEDGRSICDPLKCGNEAHDAGEECDDGNLINGDGCSKLCFIERGYICDNSKTPSECTQSCGNGRIDTVSGEKCDDGGTEPGDGCSANCQIENGWMFNDDGELVARTCGDGFVAGTEECDDGNAKNLDGCSARCKRETNWHCDTAGKPCERDVCGDSRKTGDEMCDDGNNVAGDGCSDTCKIEPGYECLTEGSACTQTARCGNSTLEGGETCDDGNNAAGDGCSDICQIETSWRCPTLGEPCIKGECGNGILEEGEECDDNNTEVGDGCSPACEIEPIYDCNDFGCKPMCGDGLVIPGEEECDDGNLTNGDGCSSTCKEEKGFTCTVKFSGTPDVLELPIVYHDFPRYSSSTSDVVPREAPKDASGKFITTDGYVSQDIYDKLPAHCKPGGVGSSYRHTTETGLTGYNAKAILQVGRPSPDFLSYCPGMECEQAVLPKLGVDGTPDLAPFESLKNHSAVHNSPNVNCGLLWTCPEVFKWWYNDVPGVNRRVEKKMRFKKIDGTESDYLSDTSGSFLPIEPNEGYGKGESDGTNNGEFTSHFQTYFKYRGGETLSFSGDDDVWVFFNGYLGVDVGGIHSSWSKTITLDTKKGEEVFHMYPGGIYAIDMFHAERCLGGSNYSMTLAGFVSMGQSTCDAICGDGVVRGDEECDYEGVNTDVNIQNQYGCSSTCKLKPHCGNGKIEKGEECDTTETWCKGCKLDPHTCGNGTLDEHEQCDDGPKNGTAESNCLTTCRTTGCGDGIVDETNGEECDDGNSSNDDTCTTKCKRPYCGDGIVTPSLGEVCDDGKNDGSYNGCGLGCAFEPPKCGDGIIDPLHGEECDDGDLNADNTYNVCSTKCTYGERCGDGVLQSQHEDCDPAIPGTTGCSQYCTYTIY